MTCRSARAPSVRSARRRVQRRRLHRRIDGLHVGSRLERVRTMSACPGTPPSRGGIAWGRLVHVAPPRSACRSRRRRFWDGLHHCRHDGAYCSTAPRIGRTDVVTFRERSVSASLPIELRRAGQRAGIIDSGLRDAKQPTGCGSWPDPGARGSKVVRPRTASPNGRE